MLARLVLALLLALGAMPVGATAAGCHAMPAMTAPGPGATTPHAPAREHPLVAEHGCVGCGALADDLVARVAVPLVLPGMAPVALVPRLALRGEPLPALRPPRVG